MYLSTNEMERIVLGAAIQYGGDVTENLELLMTPTAAETFADVHGDFTADEFAFAASMLYQRALHANTSDQDLFDLAEQEAANLYYGTPGRCTEKHLKAMAKLLEERGIDESAFRDGDTEYCLDKFRAKWRAN